MEDIHSELTETIVETRRDTIYFIGPVNFRSIHNLIMEMEEYIDNYCFKHQDDVELKTPKSIPLTVFIDSGGGDVEPTARFQDYMESNVLPIATTTVEIGSMAYSGAAEMMVVFDVRKANKRSFIMIHESSAESVGGTTQMMSVCNYFSAMEDNFRNTFLLYTGMPVDEYKRIKEEETFLCAKEALGLGIIHEIVG